MKTGIIGAGRPSAIGLASKILADQTTGVVHPATSGLLAKDGGVHEVGSLSGAEMYAQIKDFISNLPDKVEGSNDIKSIPLASSFHEFKSPVLAEAYQDSDLTSVGAGYLDEIAGLKDQLLTDNFKIHVPRLAPNKSGHYYLRKLTRSDRKKYLKNFKTQVYSIPVKMWLDSEALDMEDFLGSAFTWVATPEGHDYWEQIDDRMRWAFDIQNNKKS